MQYPALGNVRKQDFYEKAQTSVSTLFLLRTRMVWLVFGFCLNVQSKFGVLQIFLSILLGDLDGLSFSVATFAPSIHL